MSFARCFFGEVRFVTALSSRRTYNQRTMKHVVKAACPHDCPDACGVLITVEDGRATKIQGDPTHPVTRGFLCAKVSKYLDRVYSPERVLYPMRRIGPKGPAAGVAQQRSSAPGQPSVARSADPQIG